MGTLPGRPRQQLALTSSVLSPGDADFSPEAHGCHDVVSQIDDIVIEIK